MQLWLIPIFPLAGFLINGIFGRRFSKSLVNTVAVGSVLLSFLWVVKTHRSRMGDLEHAAPGALLHLDPERHPATSAVDFAVDRLTAVMLLVVTGIGSLIHIYAIGYMAHEGGYYRFFAYLNLFMFFMLVLVLGANFLLLFVGWEGVGLCSYLLIGFYFAQEVRHRRRQQGIHRQPHRRFRLRAGDVPDLHAISARWISPRCFHKAPGATEQDADR